MVVSSFSTLCPRTPRVACLASPLQRTGTPALCPQHPNCLGYDLGYATQPGSPSASEVPEVSTWAAITQHKKQQLNNSASGPQETLTYRVSRDID